ncbi:uncharacterized protein LOC124168861 [Ischnura elegans]|uniref:uncharacterized protein LOC124168861 n=1 Tax=Ischnura elegans TaxID=197161 RepID=UPI001ED8AA42|nr:uncharacterized protein LOC124168861 [Ischnura elegans]
MDSSTIGLGWAHRLFEAVENVDITAVKHLVNLRGVKPDEVLPKYGISPFHLAVGVQPLSFSEEVTKTFIAAGGNPNIRSSEGVTPVHVSAIWGRAKNLKLLLLGGGDPLILDDDGYSALNYAEEHHHLACTEIIQKFVEFGKPAFGLLLNVIGNETTARESENINDLNARKISHEQDKLMNSSGCRVGVGSSVLNGLKFQSGYHSEVGRYKWFPHPQIKNDTLKSVEAEGNDLISDSNCNGDSDLITDDADHSPEENGRNKRRGVSNETYVIYGSPKVGLLYNCPQNDDCMTQDESENYLNDECKGNNVGEINLTYSVQDNAFYPWANFYRADGSYSDRVSCLASGIRVSTSSPNENCMQSPLQLISPPLCARGNIDYPVYEVDKCSQVQRRIDFDKSWETSSTLSSSCPDIHRECFEQEFRCVTTRREVRSAKCMGSKGFTFSKSESEDYFTVPEEINEIEDEEEGILLEEKRLETPVIPGHVIPQEPQICRRSSMSSLTSGCTVDIRRELKKVASCGCSIPVGPVTATTKRVYQRMIRRFKKKNRHLMREQIPLPPAVSYSSKFSSELEETLANPLNMSHTKYFAFEQKMTLQFDGCGRFNEWREGNQKSSFNYLLLDPRMTLNLPSRWAADGSSDKSFFSGDSSKFWREFINSIFYVGKGKRSRPYSHLYEAVAAWRNKSSGTPRRKKKLRQIIEIWNQDLGVVCLHLFQNVIPAEALTREAAMIDAIGIKNLTNEQRRKYYGFISTLGFSEKRFFGSFLLHRAFIIFLAEGERQIKPAHLS